MDTLHVRIPGRVDAADVAELLETWLAHTPWADRVADVRPRADSDEVVATLTRGDRRVELTATPEAPGSDAWLLHAVTWLVPATPTRGWSSLAGFTVFAFGFAVAAGYLAWSTVAFWTGVGVAAILGVVVHVVVTRHARMGRMTARPSEGGPARELIDVLAPVVRSDLRVGDVERR